MAATAGLVAARIAQERQSQGGRQARGGGGSRDNVQESLSELLARNNWNDGNTGPLRAGHPLMVNLVRDESQTWVQPDYKINMQEADDVFTAFVCLRVLHRQQHPDVVPEDDRLINMGEINRVDVKRAAMFICETEAFAEQETNRFMKEFDEDEGGGVSRGEFMAKLRRECEKRQLTDTERFFFLFDEPTSSTVSFRIAIFVMGLIVASSVGFIMASEPHYQTPADNDDLPPVELPGFGVLEAICIIAFTIEYCSRAFTCGFVRDHVREPEIPIIILQATQKRDEEGKLVPLPKEVDPWAMPEEPAPCRKAYKYLTQNMNLIDIVAILPWYMELIGGGGGGLAVLRILRLARIFRIFKVGKYSEGINILANVMVNSVPALNLLAFFFAIGIVLFGAMIFFAEQGTWQPPNDDYPRGSYLRPDVLGNEMAEVSPFNSIPRCFWWVVVTATTVGYGDMYPTTAGGKIIATITMIAGLLILALPITIVGANFAMEYEEVEEKKRRAAEKAALQALIDANNVAQSPRGDSSGSEGEGEDEAVGDDVDLEAPGTTASPKPDAAAEMEAKANVFVSARRSPSFFYDLKEVFLREHKDVDVDVMRLVYKKSFKRMSIAYDESTPSPRSGRAPAAEDSPRKYSGVLHFGKHGEESKVVTEKIEASTDPSKRIMEETVHAGQRLMDLVCFLNTQEKLTETASSNISREVYDMIVALRDRIAGIMGPKEYGSKVDGAVHVFTAVLEKAMHGDPEGKDMRYVLSPEDERKLRYRFIKFMLRLYPASDPGKVEERRKSKTKLALEAPEFWESKAAGNTTLAEELEEDELEEDDEDEEKLDGLSLASGYKMGGDISM